MNPRDLALRAYVAAFFGDWITGMCGPASVPFAAIALWANARYVKVLWGCLAVLCFFLASYRVWRKERNTSLREHENAESERAALAEELAFLSRKPYGEDLVKTVKELLGQLSDEGKAVLRQLLRTEPVENGRPILKDVSVDRQYEQVAIAFGMGVLRHEEQRAGSGNLIRTNLVVTAQFRPALEDLLFPRV